MDSIDLQTSIMGLVRRYESGQPLKILDEQEINNICTSLNQSLNVFHNSEENVLSKLRTLRQTEITLTLYLKTHDKDPWPFICNTCLMYLDIEIDILNTFISNPSIRELKTYKSKLLWTGKLSNLMEFICLLYFSGDIGTTEEDELTFMKLVREWEVFLNVRIKDPYKVRAQIANRKKSTTPYFDSVKELYLDNMRDIGIG